MPDLTRLAAWSGEIVSPGICDPLPVGIRVRRKVYNENWRKEGSPFSLSLDDISLRLLVAGEQGLRALLVDALSWAGDAAKNWKLSRIPSEPKVTRDLELISINAAASCFPTQCSELDS